jgi:hypothetical protein
MLRYVARRVTVETAHGIRMLAKLRDRLSFGNVVAVLALFVALGGSSYAALKLPKGSVGPRQIRANAVSSPKVRDRSLFARDFALGQLPKGEKGDKGDKGDPGQNAATHVVSRRVSLTVSDAEGTSVVAHCHPGERVISGGFFLNSSGQAKPKVTASAPVDPSTDMNFETAPEGAVPTGWRVVFDNFDATGTGTATATAFALCASP